MKITAAVVDEKSGPFELRELELDAPRSDEILVRIVATGICQTDLHVRDQEYPVPLPAVLGHEGAGIVEAVGGAVRSVGPGDHVILSYQACGHCRPCLRGSYSYCERAFEANFGGARLDGSNGLSNGAGPDVHGHFFGQSSFATYSLATERNVVEVPRDVPLELLGPLGCGLQTGAGAVLNSLRVPAGASLAVFGSGAVGLAAIMAARVAGANPIVAVDVNPKRLELARELGASHVLDPREIDLRDALAAIVPGGLDFVLEITARPELLKTAVDVLAPLGTAALIGGAPQGTEAPIDMNNLLFGRTVRGIVQGDSIPQLFVPQLIEMYRAGDFPFDRLVRFYEFEEINQAVADTRSGTTVKPILRVTAA
ncbi:MAG: aryl-alcohol dehydrogenase [Solirubrobacteraceae bacterium]